MYVPHRHICIVYRGRQPNKLHTVQGLRSHMCHTYLSSPHWYKIPSLHPYTKPFLQIKNCVTHARLYVVFTPLSTKCPASAKSDDWLRVWVTQVTFSHGSALLTKDLREVELYIDDVTFFCPDNYVSDVTKYIGERAAVCLARIAMSVVWARTFLVLSVVLFSLVTVAPLFTHTHK